MIHLRYTLSLEGCPNSDHSFIWLKSAMFFEALLSIEVYSGCFGLGTVMVLLSKPNCHYPNLLRVCGRFLSIQKWRKNVGRHAG